MVSLGVLIINQVKGRHLVTTSTQHRYHQRRAVLHLAMHIRPCAVLASGDKACLRRAGRQFLGHWITRLSACCMLTKLM